MIELHLYGKLRRCAPKQACDDDSVVALALQGGQTIGQVLAGLGIAPEETSNIFVNGELSALSRQLRGDERVGVFPDDMALLYKWYFDRKK